jgi:hypothetical protein
MLLNHIDFLLYPAFQRDSRQWLMKNHFRVSLTAALLEAGKEAIMPGRNS